MPIAEFISQPESAEISGWSTSRSTARSTATSHSSSGAARAVAVSSDNSLYFYYRYYLRFSVSLQSGSTINSAKIRMTPTLVTPYAPGTPNWSISVCTGNWGAYSPITTGNRQSAYSLGVSAPEEALWGGVTTLSANVPRDTAALNTAAIPISAAVYYIVRLSLDISNNNYGLNNNYGAQIATRNHATEAYRPRLIIDYTPPPPPANQVFVVGL